jgi:hypothetical protein
MAASMEMEHWMRTVYYYNLNDCDKLCITCVPFLFRGDIPPPKIKILHDNRELVM